MKKVYTKIVGDLFHYGHVHFLKQLKAFADYTVVHVVDDDRVTAYKRQPIMTQSERIQVVEACIYIDEVVGNGPKVIDLKFMRENGYDFYAYSFQSEQELWDKRNDCPDLLEDMRLELPYTEGISTTLIIKRIKDRIL
jgi:cytidyltransferase-like protein